MEVFTRSGDSYSFNHLPPEILHHILSYVGTNRKDLLACRVVSNSWNQTVLKILKPISLYITLNELIQLHDKNSKSTPTPMADEEKNYILCLADEDTKLSSTKLEILKRIEKRIYPITTIKFLEPLFITLGLFWKLLNIASNTLRVLHVGSVLEPQAATEGAQSNSVPREHTTFPQVTSIRCYLGQAQPTKLGTMILLNTLIHLMNQSPILESFKLRDAVPDLWTDEKQVKLIIILNSILETNRSSTTLKELELSIYGHPTFTTLSAITFNVLQSLHISPPQSFNYTTEREFGLFLQNNCARLTSLYIHIWNDYSSWQLNDIQINQLPCLPKLTRLGFSCGPSRLDISLSTIYLEMCLKNMTTKFQSLETLTTDLPTFLGLSNSYKIRERHLKFPSVSKFILKVRQTDWIRVEMRRRFRNVFRDWLPNL